MSQHTMRSTRFTYTTLFRSRTAGDEALRHQRHPHVLRKRSSSAQTVAAVKLPLDWLRDFVAVPDDVRVVARRLAAVGFEVAGIENDVIDFEITANRPDCMSVYGLARET